MELALPNVAGQVVAVAWICIALRIDHIPQAAARCMLPLCLTGQAFTSPCAISLRVGPRQMNRWIIRILGRAMWASGLVLFGPFHPLPLLRAL